MKKLILVILVLSSIIGAANLALSTTPQQLVGSTDGVLIKASSHFTYGFGDTAPSIGIDWATPQLPLDYKGGRGTLWIWADSVDDASNIYYEIGAEKKVYLNDGLGNPIKSFRGAIDIHDADVHREIINDRFHQHTATTTTLAANAPAGSIDINLTSATGFAVGDYLHIQNGTIELHHPRITVLTGTKATLDRPLDHSFVAGDNVTKTIQSMDVLGTLTSPQSFKVSPQANEIWHLVGILIELTHSTAGDNGLFGNLPELVNGVVLRKYDGLTASFHTFTVWKTNGTIVTDMGQVNYTARSGGGGNYGTNAYGNFKVNAGATVYLNGAAGDYLEILIQDDLTTLDRFRVKVQGHYEGA